MIKYFCDRCGKEIDGKVHEAINTTEAINYVTGKVVATYKSAEHICDECEQKDLTCGFKVGDQVITSTGKVGHIDWICNCDSCSKRGFFEPHIEMEIGVGNIYITNNDKKTGFRSFYKIGDRVFGNIDELSVEDDIVRTNSQIVELEEDLKQYHMQLDVIKCMKNGEELWEE